ncbi:hypothetical protein GCM10010387_01820 [Streptomyces inusitatus]|uniref:Uncharacterized protein n=1 Tax=Streptomyces inusitatus TaxID=68221 RepID=A0A918PJQ1_9ACTN|nr:hypothetical protein [Streptomyces inusitatus]GGZ13427.1 hypothetical protein GCM10010387_01820 [Streptomyces inusitatus]
MSALFPEPTDHDRLGDLDAAGRIEVGDTLLSQFPTEATWRSEAFKHAANRHGLQPSKAREYVVLARWFSSDMRTRIFSNVQVSYTVLRDAARDYSRSNMPDHQRWDALRSMIETATIKGRKRVTAAEYRTAIGSRPVPNQASTMPAEAVVRQLERPDVWQAVIDYIAADPASRREVLRQLLD